MNKFFLSLFAALFFSMLHAQVLIDDTQTNAQPNASAVLDLNSNSRGLLLPRTDNAPANPVDGMVYYDAAWQCFRGYSNGAWLNLGGVCQEPVLPSVSFEVAAVSFDEADEIASVNIAYENTTGAPITINVTASANPLGLVTETNPISIPAGTGNYDYTFEWTDNATNDGNASFTLNITSGTGYTVGSPASVTVTIVEDDAPAAEPVELLNENFASITTGNSTSSNGSGTTWGGNTNFPTVATAYQAGGAVRLGSSSATGSITSKSLDFSQGSGTVKVTFDVKGWTANEGDIKVSVGGQEQIITYTAVMAGNFETKTATFTGVTGTGTVKIETTAKRAFIDNVIISVE